MAQKTAVKTMQVTPHKEGKLTILTLLKNFYDEEIFQVLVKEFYNPDIDISLKAIESSASIGNDYAIPHLYKIIERGGARQKISAIKALAEIKSPSSLDRLIKYYNYYHENGIRQEILKAVNNIMPTGEKIQQFNKAVLTNIQTNKLLKNLLLQYVGNNCELKAIIEYIKTASAESKKHFFLNLLERRGRDVAEFVEYFKPHVKLFEPAAMGAWTLAYLLKSINPEQKFITQSLSAAGSKAYFTFCNGLLDREEYIERPIKVLKILLLLPFLDMETENIICQCLDKLIEKQKDTSLYILNEFSITVHAHLESVFSKVSKNSLLLNGSQSKKGLLLILLCRLLGKYADSTIADQVKYYLLGKGRISRERLISTLTARLKKATKSDLNQSKACFTLFNSNVQVDNREVINIFSRIDFKRPSQLRRLNRLLQVAGELKIKPTLKTIQKVLEFSRKERINFLEQNAIIVLCKLLNKEIIEDAGLYFSQPDKNLPSFKGYIIGARFLPPKMLINQVLNLLNKPFTKGSIRTIAVETLEKMQFDGLKGIWDKFVKSLLNPEINQELKKRIGDVIARYADSSIFELLLELTYNTQSLVKIIAITTIKKMLMRKIPNIPLESLTNRLYFLLEDKQIEVRFQALYTLLILKDDYAIEVLIDYLSAENDKEVADFIRQLPIPFSHEILMLLLKKLTSTNTLVHQSLREILTQLISTDYAEEIRNTLLSNLKYLPPKEEQPVEEKEQSIISQAKLEFKYRRENSQILTVFFIDMADYTEKSSASDISHLMKLIDSFENIVLPLINEYKGTLIKKMGDGMLVVFKHPFNAVITALNIQKKIAEYNQYHIQAEKYQVRIGLNTGMVIRKANDIYGYVVNIASRMETAAKPGEILLTQATYDEIKNYVKCTRLGNINVKGKKHAITAYLAEEIRVDIKNILKEEAQEKIKYTEKGEENPILKLKESIFNPDFSIPQDIQKNNHRNVLQGIKTLFTDLNSAMEEVSKDSHEEYIFKKYLQDKWDEFLKLWENNKLKT